MPKSSRTKLVKNKICKLTKIRASQVHKAIFIILILQVTFTDLNADHLTLLPNNKLIIFHHQKVKDFKGYQTSRRICLEMLSKRNCQTSCCHYSSERNCQNGVIQMPHQNGVTYL